MQIKRSATVGCDTSFSLSKHLEEPASDRFYMCLSMLESRRWHTLAKQSGKIFLKIFQKTC